MPRDAIIPFLEPLRIQATWHDLMLDFLRHEHNHSTRTWILELALRILVGILKESLRNPYGIPMEISLRNP